MIVLTVFDLRAALEDYPDDTPIHLNAAGRQDRRFGPKNPEALAAICAGHARRKPNASTLARVRRIAQRKAEGASVRAIAAELGCSGPAVVNLFKRHRRALGL